MKCCTKCHEVKPLAAFEPHSTGRNGLRAQCTQCVKAQRAAYHAARHRTPRNRDRKKVTNAYNYAASPRQALKNALKHALTRRPSATPATVDELLAMFVGQNGRCALSGVLMTWGSGQMMPMPTSMALDRIDRSLGYERGNIRLVCNSVNNFRGVMDDPTMIEMLRQFHAHLCGPGDYVAGLLSEAA